MKKRNVASHNNKEKRYPRYQLLLGCSKC